MHLNVKLTSFFEMAKFDWFYHYSGKCTTNVMKGHQTLDQRVQSNLGSGHARLSLLVKGLVAINDGNVASDTKFSVSPLSNRGCMLATYSYVIYS